MTLVRLYYGQAYLFAGDSDYVDKRGEARKLAQWTTRCVDCGILFTFSHGRYVKGEINWNPRRRCIVCRGGRFQALKAAPTDIEIDTPSGFFGPCDDQSEIVAHEMKASADIAMTLLAGHPTYALNPAYAEQEAATLDVLRARRHRMATQAGEEWAGTPLVNALGLNHHDVRHRRRVLAILRGWLRQGKLREVDGRDPRRRLRRYVEVVEPQVVAGHSADLTDAF